MISSPLVLVAQSVDGSIASYRLEGDELVALATTSGLHGCSTFVVDSARDLVYAATKGAAAGEPAGIVTLALDRESGRLEPRSRRDLASGGMNYLALTRDGTALLGASYGGGYGIVSAVSDGEVGEPVSTVEFPNLHAVLPSADGRFAYFVSLGADLVAQYAIGDDLSLRALTPETVAAPAGSGPRHLVLPRSQDAVYVITEFSGEVLHYARDTATGVLSRRGSATYVDPVAALGRSRFGADPREGRLIWGADLHFGADEAYLWASERTQSTLGAVRLTAEGGVESADEFTITESQPRGFALNVDGTRLIAAGERSTTLSLYAVDGPHLQLLHRADVGRGANWVRVV